jgi:hypothetical protein
MAPFLNNKLSCACLHLVCSETHIINCPARRNIVTRQSCGTPRHLTLLYLSIDMMCLWVVVDMGVYCLGFLSHSDKLNSFYAGSIYSSQFRTLSRLCGITASAWSLNQALPRVLMTVRVMRVVMSSTENGPWASCRFLDRLSQFEGHTACLNQIYKTWAFTESQDICLHGLFPIYLLPNQKWNFKENSKKNKEVLEGTNRLLSLIRHGPYTKGRIQKLFCHYLCIHCRGSICTELLPSNEKRLHIDT